MQKGWLYEQYQSDKFQVDGSCIFNSVKLAAVRKYNVTGFDRFLFAVIIQSPFAGNNVVRFRFAVMLMIS